jgi:hypothetical protein
MIKYLPLLFLSLIISAEVKAQSFTFAAMSNSRGGQSGVNQPVLSALVKHLLANHPETKFLLFPGGLINGHQSDTNSVIRQYKKWKEVMKPVYASKMLWPYIWPMPGDHEIQNRFDENIYRREFPDVFNNGPEDEKGLTYSFDYNDVHFIAISTNRWRYGIPGDTAGGRNDYHYIKNPDWLELNIKTALERGAKYIIVMGHEQPFPVGGHLKDGLPNLGADLTFPPDSAKLDFLARRNRFWKILAENNVSAYICGHEHLYSRQSVDGVYQILAGSAGAPVYYFNSKFGDNPQTKKNGQEFTYNEALPYYKVLNYNYDEKGNCQASDDFVGRRTFDYVVFKVTPENIEVKTYGGYPKDDSLTELGTEIELIDKFVIKKKD